MPIYVIDTIQQKGTAEFPLVGDEDLGGGFRVVADIAARDAILLVYRKTGMFVFTTATSQLWYWTGVGNAWIEWTSGGAAASNALTDTLVAAENILAGNPVAINAVGQAINSDATAGGGAAQEMYGLAAADTTVGNPVAITTSGVHVYAGAVALPAQGTTLYVRAGAGGSGERWSSTPPDPSTSPSGTRIHRIGQVRAADSILVRPQLIAQT